MRQTHAEFHNKRCQRILGKLRKRSLKACIVDLTKQSYSVNERRWNPQSNFIGYVLSPKWSKHDLKMYYLVKDVYKTFHQSSNIAKICCLADLIILIHVLDSYWFPREYIWIFSPEFSNFERSQTMNKESARTEALLPNGTTRRWLGMNEMTKKRNESNCQIFFAKTQPSVRQRKENWQLCKIRRSFKLNASSDVTYYNKYFCENLYLSSTKGSLGPFCVRNSLKCGNVPFLRDIILHIAHKRAIILGTPHSGHVT